jgi:hypothetical protein
VLLLLLLGLLGLLLPLQARWEPARQAQGQLQPAPALLLAAQRLLLVRPA